MSKRRFLDVTCESCGSVWGVSLRMNDASVAAELRNCPICQFYNEDENATPE